ncbi:S-layer homology domain-containing protein [Paenibacillaceae bacterium]|nr:S-layer homology domain-containing protein [Paenibacillaceae bacterium]
MKKYLIVMLAFCLLIGGGIPQPSGVSAAAEFFQFQNEQYSAGSARTVLTDRVTLNGTINNVIGSSISYTVDQITLKGTEEEVVNSNENQTANIQLNGNNITVLNVLLYPGLNRLTFKGTQGFSEVTSVIYIEYRNSPTLYDLTANIDGQQFIIQETGTTVVYSNNSRNKASYDISITGKAPNADKVTVVVNNRSYTYPVSSSNNWAFAASPLNVKQGKNSVTIKVHNKSQLVETTREIAFYNGEATFYDLQLVGVHTAGTSTVPLENNPNFSVAPGTKLLVKGKAILPLKVTTENGVVQFAPNWDDLETGLKPSGIKIKFNDGAFMDPNTGTVNLLGSAPGPNDAFITVEFEKDVISSVDDTNNADYNKQFSLRLQANNYMKTPSPTIENSGIYTFKLRNGSQPYIYEVNHLPGYTSTTESTQLEAMTGIKLDGTNISSLPMGVELLIGNPGTHELVPEISNVKLVTGIDAKDTEYKVEVITPASDLFVTKTVDGVEQQFRRVFLKVTMLPTSGSQTLTFKLKDFEGTQDAKVNLLYGPYVKFEKLYDAMPIKYDTTLTPDIGKDVIIGTELANLRGELLNVSTPADIRYSNVDSNKLQSVFLYINNIEVKLKPLDPGNINHPKFEVLDPAQAFDALYKGGENTIKFVFRTKNNNYESQMKLVIQPTNLPVIPVPGTSGVFPYSINYSTPMPNDPNFVLQGDVYTTKEAKMNVFGTFDFIDLGVSAPEVRGRLADSVMNEDARKKFMLRIVTDGASDIVWTLNNGFYIDGELIGTPASLINGITVYYDTSNQTFSFLLQDQNIPEDGSSKVYNFFVYNSGINGPKAQHRLEVDPVNIPYTILAPKMEKTNLNQNFVEVIITSPGAESIVVNKIEARKITYLDYGNLVGSNPTEITAFSAVIPKLKENKTTKIDFTISRGTDKTNGSFNVIYTPENIPGAQIMEKMSSSHKLFAGAFELKFPSGTNLIRRDYNVPDNLKGQVYNGNDLLFGVANPEDGVIDRHDFESVPANYDLQVNMGRIYFTASFPDRFIKSSPVYWVDAGEADNAMTPNLYDPILAGYDPLPYSKEKGLTRSFYYDRDPGRELRPSKRGTLTLKYDASVRKGAGTQVTVFRFDPFVKQWENIGGVVNDSKNTITVPFDRFGYYVVGKLSYGFGDINDHPYARIAGEAIFSKGVMNAIDPSGVFGTDMYVSRAEFARMIVRAMELPLNYDGPNHFFDVPNFDSSITMEAIWDYRYIETAARAGIVRGTLPRIFDPESPISRQDAAVMLANALNLKQGTEADKVRKDLQKAFKDEASIQHYAKPAVAAILKKGFIQGSPVSINDPSQGFVYEPVSRLLRAEAAMIISRVMTDQKKLPKLYTK